MDKKTKKGISLREILIWMIVIMVVMGVVVGYSTYHLTSTFNDITDAANEHIELEKAAHELMDASDYLTENVQRFTIDGERKYLEQYFTEAFETNRREEAVEKMDTGIKTETAHKYLKEAMANSLELMDREYYAMRLVIEAKEYTDYPEVLKNIELTGEDKKLSADEKMRRASSIVLDSEYYEQKNSIRNYYRECIEEVDKIMYSAEGSELSSLHRELKIVRIVVIVQTLLIFFMIWLTSHLGINPILNAVDRIKEDSPISEKGANEFKYLAQAYNKMYSKYKNSLEHLNYKASHDELTGAYNRAGYELLLSTIDIESTYMMLLDVDNFKTINDTYGHETGDRVLIKLVRVLQSVFRADDHICRIGGDEFVVFMVHSDNINRKFIKVKIEQINRELENTDDGLPTVSISIGIMHGKEATDVTDLFEMTDSALYESKKKGKNTYTFVTEKKE
ncbi:MAG: GGDEF domain-containing protein [Lachnospiraceae bacterium]|nr:GGDEF domain-containing protein [Lachnospiraceae bacterium]